MADITREESANKHYSATFQHIGFGNEEYSNNRRKGETMVLFCTVTLWGPLSKWSDKHDWRILENSYRPFNGVVKATQVSIPAQDHCICFRKYKQDAALW